MKAIEFAGQNFVFNPPSTGMKHGTCGMLPVMRMHDPYNSGVTINVSVYKPTPEEIQSLVEGAHVLLHVWGPGHPPVAITVQKMEELP